MTRIILTYTIDVPDVEAVAVKYNSPFDVETLEALEGKNRERLDQVARDLVDSYGFRKLATIDRAARLEDPNVFGIDELRAAANAFGFCNETLLQSIGSAERLLNVWRAMTACEWDLYPDEWTEKQLEAAAFDGTSPTFEDKDGWVHATGVDDCICRGCKR